MSSTPSPKWSQDESIAFECARDCISDLMGILTAAIAAEEAQQSPREGHIAKLVEERSSLHHELAVLRVSDKEQIAKIRHEYGSRIRAHRAPQKPGTTNMSQA